jgi:hypothetical protein
MNSPAIQEALSAIRDCALAMLGNASYVQGELPNVEMAPSLKTHAVGLCEDMIGTKHDIISEVFEVDELLDSNADQAVISSRLNRCIRWLGQDISRLHELVMALRADTQQNEKHTMGLILVQESAANILNAFNRAKSAVDMAIGEGNESRNA